VDKSEYSLRRLAVRVSSIASDPVAALPVSAAVVAGQHGSGGSGGAAERNTSGACQGRAAERTHPVLHQKRKKSNKEKKPQTRIQPGRVASEEAARSRYRKTRVARPRVTHG